MQIGELSLDEKKLIESLLESHQKAAAEKLQGFPAEPGSPLAALRQHELEVHAKLGLLCRRVFEEYEKLHERTVNFGLREEIGGRQEEGGGFGREDPEHASRRYNRGLENSWG